MAAVVGALLVDVDGEIEAGVGVGGEGDGEGHCRAGDGRWVCCNWGVYGGMGKNGWCRCRDVVKRGFLYVIWISLMVYIRIGVSLGQTSRRGCWLPAN